MGFGLNGLFHQHLDIETDMMIAAAAGYDAVEIQAGKIIRYLQSGFTLADFNSLLHEYEISISSIGTLDTVDTLNSVKVDKFLSDTKLLAGLAVENVCDLIRLHGSSEMDDLSVRDNIKFTAHNIRRLCEIGRDHGFRFQYEGAAWNPINSIENYRMLIDEVEMDNFGVAIDFWNLWAGRGGTPDELSNIDKDSLFSVYITDGRRPVNGEIRPEDLSLRSSLPGDGEVPVTEWVEAVKSVGFTGLFSSGYFYDEKHDAGSLTEMAADNLSRMKMYF